MRALLALLGLAALALASGPAAVHGGSERTAEGIPSARRALELKEEFVRVCAAAMPGEKAPHILRDLLEELVMPNGAR